MIEFEVTSRGRGYYAAEDSIALIPESEVRAEAMVILRLQPALLLFLIPSRGRGFIEVVAFIALIPESEVRVKDEVILRL
jgi:hypothetical protein